MNSIVFILWQQKFIHEQFGNGTCSQSNLDFDVKFVYTSRCLLTSQEFRLYDKDFLFKLAQIINNTITLFLEPSDRTINFEDLTIGFILEKINEIFKMKILRKTSEIYIKIDFIFTIQNIFNKINICTFYESTTTQCRTRTKRIRITFTKKYIILST